MGMARFSEGKGSMLFNTIVIKKFVSLSMHLGLFAALVFSYCEAFAKEPLSAQIVKTLQGIYPGAARFEWETGLINSDEVNDLAVIVYVDRPATQGLEALAVFYGNPDGSYRLSASSLLWPARDRIEWILSIERKSVFMSIECKALCGNAADSGNFQFKEYKGALSLVGERLTTLENPTQAEDRLNGYSINYLVGQAEFWRRIGKRHKRVTTRFKDFPPPALSKFDLWTGKDPRPKEARGYLDEHFRYVSF